MSDNRDLKNPLTGNNNGQRLSRLDLEHVPLPASQRKCTDVLFCLVFVLMWVGMIVLAGYSISTSGGVNGYERLTNGVQYDGEICGVSSSVKDDVYLWWPNPVQSSDFAVCVSACPTSSSDQICRTVDSAQQCWDTYASDTVYHYCIPSSDSSFKSAVENDIAGNTFGRMVADIGVAWPALVAAGFIAVATGFLYLWMLWILGPCLVYGTIVFLIVAMALGGYFLVHRASTSLTGDERTALMATGIACWVLDIVFMLLVCCMRKSLSLAITCLKQATRAINDIKRVLFLPVIKFFVLMAIMVWFAIVAVYIVSAGKFTTEPLHVPGTTLTIPYKKVEWTKDLRYSLLYLTFGSVWSLAFVLASADVILAGVFSRWYFTTSTNGTRQLQSPVSNAVAVVKKQGGSIALGSLVLTIIWLIKAMLRYIHKRLKDSPAGGNIFVKFIMCCCMCFVNCFECCVKYLERQAYIEMAIFGNSFCSSAKRAFQLIARNAMSFVATGYITSVFSILGVVLVVAVSCLSTYAIVVSAYSGANGVSSPVIIVVIAFMMSWTVGHIFMTVLDMAIQTILHCFIADTEAHGQPQYLSATSEMALKLQDAKANAEARNNAN